MRRSKTRAIRRAERSRDARAWARACAREWRDERGSASLEFITAGLILLVPLVYLVVAVAGLQAGALAVEGAARQAARVYVQAPTDDEARALAERAVAFALADHGFALDRSALEVRCGERTDGCLMRGARVTVTVRLSVPLPLVPSALDLATAASVPLEGRATQTVSRFWGPS
jgi:Flp pilus assembly protein TadG